MRYCHLPGQVFAACILWLFVVCIPAFAQNQGQAFGSWTYTCKNERCEAFVGRQEGDKAMFVWSLLRDRDKGQVRSVIRVPLGVALPAGLRIYTSESRFFTLDFQVCKAVGCAAVTVMDDAMQAAIAATESVRIVFIPFDQVDPAHPKTVTYEVRVDGFKKALDAL